MNDRYRAAGVDMNKDKENAPFVKRLGRSTLRPEVMGDIGGFGAFCRIPQGYQKPVLVSGADGVGTKVLVATLMDKHDTIGIDCVAMNVDDVVVSGAEPLFFLDYLAVGKLDSARFEAVLEGIAEGCRQAGCALIGGETSQMPDIYQDDHYDLAGFCVGVVEEDEILDGSRVHPGSALVALGSSGIHSNGYSLARQVLLDEGPFRIESHIEELGRTLGEELLEPTRIYARDLLAIKEALPLLGASHITGGGITENLPRILPPGTSATVEKNSWRVPPIFELIKKLGKVDDEEMFRVFNMGVGMIAVVPAEEHQRCIEVAQARGLKAWYLGQVTAGEDHAVRYL